MDYLNDRHQFVQVHDKQSDYLLVTHGVPQGSIPELVLFNIYVSKHAWGTCFQYTELV